MKSFERKSIVFVCSHNSARSQMAEGLLRSLFGDRFDVYSAGTVATHVKRPAIEAMAEIGIDISSQQSKTLDDLADLEMDYVVTVCDSAREQCPYARGRIATLHKSFPDPSNAGETKAEQLEAFRRTRDDMRRWIEEQFAK